ncbi:probable serine/threonine-protein kinase At1g09600 isoform X2 [Vitis riparia]|uniref:probable serine/threonine-protein kinase At1g09600 isoform X2 n=1 Tax=Vitis riparia TaxID=96939 RepID=UPI00155A4D86|nr:probable serine/threonine-protein kinase At1g09600 isoform X2 [Vitis riparia]
MGCICSKEASVDEYVDYNEREKEKEKELNKDSVQLVAPSTGEEFVMGPGGGGGHGRTGGSVHPISKSALQGNVGSAPIRAMEGEKKAMTADRPTKASHQRRLTLDMENNVGPSPMSRIVSMPNGAKGEQIVAGWPSWLSSVAGEAIQGWVPLRPESYEKLDKIGQGTYSTVYRARDLDSGKIVALKKVRFGNMDPESVRFMAREIHVLRKLDHPNVMKLEGLITSRTSGTLYLVFEYMEHDLAGLSATPGIKFTEPQIKCYMQQLLRGLEHCHSRGVLHRDIKGSNLLIDNKGVLKIGDFGLASFRSDPSQPLTSRVVTLWYRPPELLLGATKYGASVDLWSTGCIIAELFAGSPIMPGSTEVEQIHKIFKLCGSPSEEYWQKSKLAHASSFKPQHPYKRRLAETFRNFPSSALALVDVLLSVEPDARGTAASALKSEFFTTKPLPCDPSSFPKYVPSKEYDAKLRNEEARRQRAEAVKGRGAESVRRGSRQSKDVPTPEFKPQAQASLQGQTNTKCISEKYKPGENSGSNFRMEPHRGTVPNGLSHSTLMINQNAVGSSQKKVEDEAQLGFGHTFDSSRNNAELRTHGSHMPHGAAGVSSSSHRKDERISGKESVTGYVPKKNRMHYSGPLMPPGGNIEEMLKDHERQIQEAVRKARIDKTQQKL